MTRPTPLEVRFWRKVEGGDVAECWLWTAAVNRRGYGLFGNPRGSSIAHRIAYTLLIGDVPEGLQLDHLCRVRRCVNPWHLDPVTDAVNRARGVAARRRTTCVHGHELVGRNLIVVGGTGTQAGQRRCRTCKAITDARRHQRRKGVAA